MNPRRKEALLWGVVGLLTFLVLVQGYELLQDVRIDWIVKIGGALVVAVASTLITYLTTARLADGDGTATGGDDRDGSADDADRTN